MCDFFNNPFDLSSNPFNTKFYYHWCVFIDDKPIIQGKDFKNIDDVAKDIKSNSRIGKIKVIRTSFNMEETLLNENHLDDIVMLPDDEINENDIFLVSKPYIADVTSEILLKLKEI